MSIIEKISQIIKKLNKKNNRKKLVKSIEKIEKEIANRLNGEEKCQHSQKNQKRN